jgi:hypothetical protein
MAERWFLVLLVACACAGCGTTKWSDSPRTATEQLLISDAVDRAISEIDFGALEDRSVFLDTRFIATTIDQNYVTSTLRQHMLASGCVIKDKAEDSDFVVEVRAGSLGTNRNDVLLGVPATQLPSVGLLPTGGAIPEIALSKRTSQQAVCKIAVFAYDRMSGRPVWQSGNRKVASSAKDTWLLGTGPFQRGNIYDGTSFAGEKIKSPLPGKEKEKVTRNSVQNSSVGTERRFDSRRENRLDDSGKVENAQYTAPLQQVPAPVATPAAAPAAIPTAAQTGPPATAPATAPPAATPSAPATAESAPAGPKADVKVEKPPEPLKAAYTPPPTKPATAQPVGTGLQGELSKQVITPVTNPAITTANAVKTYNLAKELLH